VRGQVIATRASRSVAERESFLANEGFEYWFPRPVSRPNDAPLVILGGGRETAGQYEVYNTNDAGLNDEVGKVLRRFLPSVQPDAFERGKQPEMEWVRSRAFVFVLYTELIFGAHRQGSWDSRRRVRLSWDLSANKARGSTSLRGIQVTECRAPTPVRKLSWG